MAHNANTTIVKYSVIVLLEDDEKDFAEFIQNIHKTFSDQQEPFEIIIVANGLEGFLKKEITKLSNYEDNLKAFALTRKTPQAVCLKAGFKESRGEVIVVCGSYQQLTNQSFNTLLNSLADNVDIVTPWRKDRVDPPFNQFQSRIFNNIVKKITGAKLNDLSSNVKIFRREVLEGTQLYGNMYRFLPVIAAQKGFYYKEIECEHFQERGKTGFYNISEYITRILDIFTLYFTTRFSRKPLRFFSIFGATFIILGVTVFSYGIIQKIFMDYPIGGRPVLLLAILFMVLGIQAASVGLLGEIIVFTQGRHSKEYNIEKTI